MKVFDRLYSTIKTLRIKCPWDKKQTHKSLRKYVIEEAYELVNAINSNNSFEIMDETADILIQVLLHTAIAEEKNEFTMNELLNHLDKKLKRRHPHVFSNAKAKNADEVLKNWVAIKKIEKKHKSVMDDVPDFLPSLMLSEKIQKKASAAGFEWKDMNDVYAKLYEEIDELKLAKTKAEKEDEIGDILFTTAHIAVKNEIDPETALLRAVNKFVKRFRKMESIAEKDSRDFSKMNLDDFDILWNKAKRPGRS